MLGVSIALQIEAHRGPIRETTASYSLFVSAHALGSLLYYFFSTCSYPCENSFNLVCDVILYPSLSLVFTLGGACAATAGTVSCYKVRYNVPKNLLS